MAPEEESKPRKVTKEEFDVISNRLAVALAKRESLIKSWTAASSVEAKATKTSEQLDEEDAVLFRNQPPYLGVGAPIPAHFLTSDPSQTNKALKAKFFPSKGLKASKARDADEKAASAKRAKRDDEESDEEQGRSGLGRAKKLRSKSRITPVVKEDLKEEADEEVEIMKDEPISKKVEGEKIDSQSSQPSQVVEEEPKEEVKHITSNEALNNTSNGRDTTNKSSPQEPSTEDEAMKDISTTNIVMEASSPTISSNPMDPKEKMRIKKREKKKRSRAKQKAAYPTQKSNNK